MSQKRKAQELPPAPAPVPEPSLRFCSGLGASLRNSTLEQLLFQGLATGPEEVHAGPLSIMRSNTMENILRETLSSGRELTDLMADWNQSQPEEKFTEGLASDMQAIDTAPPDVQTMRRTFTLERILSGAEADLAGMLRASQQHQLAPPQQPQHHSHSQLQQPHPVPQSLQPPSQHHHPQQHQLPRQLSATAAAAVAADVDVGSGSGGGEGGHGLRPGSRAPHDRLQRQESVHRLSASSGPGQQPRCAGGGGAPAGASGGPMGPPPSTHRPASLLRPGGGSGRYTPAVAGALAAEEAETSARSPKRHKAQHLLRSEGGPGAGPDRTWSQSLLDLAKAAAALDGRDLDEDDPPPVPGPKREAEATELGGCRGGASDRDGGEQHASHPHRQQHPQHPQHRRQAHREQEGEQEGEGEGEGKSGAEGSGRGGGPGFKRPGLDVTGGGELTESGGRNGGHWEGVGLAGDCAGPGPGSVAAEGAASSAGGGGGGGGLSAAAALLRSLSGVKIPGGAIARGGPPAPPQPSTQELKMLQWLRSEAERLRRDNDGLNGQLEAVLSQVDIMQQKNARMKQMLLEACHAKGIQADMDLLNVSLQHHRAQPMDEAEATHVAATVLGLNGGDVLATVQQLIGIALLRISKGSGGGGVAGGAPGFQR